MINIPIDSLSHLRSELRCLINDCMITSGVTQLSLEKATGIDQTLISKMLSNNKTISIPELKGISAALDVPLNMLLDTYLGDCLTGKSGEWRISTTNCKDYLITCYELREDSKAERLINYLLEIGSDYAKIFYKAAEELHLKKKCRHAQKQLYEMVAFGPPRDGTIVTNSMKRLMDTVDSNAKAELAVRIQVVIETTELPDNVVLDAQVTLGKYFFNVKDFDKMQQVAQKLIHLSQQVNKMTKNKKDGKDKNKENKPIKPLVYYYGFGLLMMGVVNQSRGNFEESLRFIDLYSDLSGFGPLDDLSKQEIEKFRKWAEGNRHTVRVLQGDLSKVDDYLDYLEKNPEEVLPGLVRLLEYSKDDDSLINSILDRFKPEIEKFGEVEDIVRYGWRYRFHYQKAALHVKQAEILLAIDDLLSAMQLADALKNFEYFRTCLSLLTRYIDQGTGEQKGLYHKIILGGDTHD